ncbi:MAG: NAD(P)H-hydrate dehydratase [Propionibacteriaceae bacterium]|jgi:NAD(P)H-hydrate repair Nnr-like enzyme with NAD(P)H-hydrate dehydratase domain|nr:NAD(P)H-hydrate dehydratase [Propionibacteriaceae bacterium]
MTPVSESDVAAWWPRPDDQADKYARGVVGVDTGSDRYPGAGVLSVLGALCSGAGFIRYCGPDLVRGALLRCAPSVTFGSGKVGVWLAGCGWDETEDNRARLAVLLGQGVPLVLDAGALTVLPSRLPPGSVLTPHAGELARLLGCGRAEVEAQPVTAAGEAARRWQVTVLLKGHHQFVVTPGLTEPAETGGRRSVFVPDPQRADLVVAQAVVGPAWTAQAGSGDTLAGIVASLIAQGCDGAHAALMGASLQAMAAARHLGPYPPDELARFLPKIIGSLVIPIRQPAEVTV